MLWVPEQAVDELTPLTLQKADGWTVCVFSLLEVSVDFFFFFPPLKFKNLFLSFDRKGYLSGLRGPAHNVLPSSGNNRNKLSCFKMGILLHFFPLNSWNSFSIKHILIHIQKQARLLLLLLTVMSYGNVNAALKGKLEIGTWGARTGSWGLFCCLSIFMFVLNEATLGWAEMGFCIRSQCGVPLIAVPKYSRFLRHLSMVSWQKGSPVTH